VTYYICCITFLGTTLACVFAPNISVLVAFRALQGLAGREQSSRLTVYKQQNVAAGQDGQCCLLSVVESYLHRRRERVSPLTLVTSPFHHFAKNLMAVWCTYPGLQHDALLQAAAVQVVGIIDFANPKRVHCLICCCCLFPLTVAAFSTTGQGVVADVFPPHLRGTAMGIFMVPLVRVSKRRLRALGTHVQPMRPWHQRMCVPQG